MIRGTFQTRVAFLSSEKWSYLAQSNKELKKNVYSNKIFKLIKIKLIHKINVIFQGSIK